MLTDALVPSTTNAKSKWTNGMIDDLLRWLGQFKSSMEYRNVDCPIDVSFFGPETTSPIPEKIEESEKEELFNIVKNEKAMIKKGYSRVMVKIKELRQRFSIKCCNSRI